MVKTMIAMTMTYEIMFIHIEQLLDIIKKNTNGFRIGEDTPKHNI